MQTAVVLDSAPVRVGRPLWRRIARGTMIVLGSLVSLVVLLVALLHTPWGKSFVRGRVERKLAALVNGEVSLGDLDYTFMFGEVTLGDLEIRDTNGRPAIRLGSLTADLDRGSVLAGAPLIEDLRVAGVMVSIVKSVDGRSNLTGLFKPSDRKPLERARVAHLAIAGSVNVRKPDGTTISVDDIAVSGSLDARPRAGAIEALVKVAAKVAIAPPGGVARQFDVAIDSVAIDRKGGSVDLDVKQLAVGALALDSLAMRVNLVDGRLRGPQTIKLGKARVDSAQLAQLAGGPVFVEDLAIDASIAGADDKLAIHGSVATAGATLALDGTVDLSTGDGTQVHPRYQLALVGNGLRSGVLAPRPNKRMPAVETAFRLDLTGAGSTPADLEAELALAIGPTKIDAVALDGISAKLIASRGAYRLEQLAARGVGFELSGTGELAADRAVRGRLAISGSPAEAMRALATAGIAVPRKLPPLSKLEVAVVASGKLDGTLAVELEPARIAIARGEITIAGHAQLEHRKLQQADVNIALRKLDLASLSRLAGRKPRTAGTLSGTVALARTNTSTTAEYGLALALRKPAISIVASGTADRASATTHARVVRERKLLATLDARLPLDGKALRPDGEWRIALDVDRRPLAELGALLPSTVRLPAGDVALHVAVAGTPSRPTGSVAMSVASGGTKAAPKLDLRAKLGPATARSLALAVDGTFSIDGRSSSLSRVVPVARLSAKLDLPALVSGGKLDLAAFRAKAKAGATIDATLEVIDGDIANLAMLRPALAKIDGKLGGRVAIRGSVAMPAIDGKLRWYGYRTATGATGQTSLALAGTKNVLSAKLEHGNAVTLAIDVDRSAPDAIEIHARALAPETKLLPLLPAFVAGRVGKHDPGRLRCDMTATFLLARGASGLALERAAVTGGLEVTGGTIMIPNSDRRWHDIGLVLESEPRGLRIRSLALRESDVEKRDRRLAVSGLLALDDKLRPRTLNLELTARDWLLFGTPTLGANDAPRAAADFDIGVDVELASPVIGVDATVRSLALRSPDRLDRGHQPELASVSGDIIYVDKTTASGRFPVVRAAVASSPGARRPLDLRIHIPRPIRINQTPFDVMAHGELTVAVRDHGIATRGALAMDSGTLSLFGRDHRLVEGALTFSDAHPQGELALTFERTLPDVAMRDLASTSGGAQITFAGSPIKPKTTLHGAAGAALAEVMAMYNAGRPVYVTRPGLPASATVQAPRGDQLLMMSFMASNLPHLLFLDRVAAWADPYQSAGSYGRIQNVEAERWTPDETARIRAVARPPTPGRSRTEVHWDRVLIHDNRKAAGVGLRVGDRLGGGLGLFFEWSSED